MITAALSAASFSPLKRFYKFIAKRVLGNFLKRKDLNIDQLEVEISTGRVTLRDLELNVDVINDLITSSGTASTGAAATAGSGGSGSGTAGSTGSGGPGTGGGGGGGGLPLYVVSGMIRHVEVIIPWRNILKQHCTLKIDGLEIVLQPTAQIEHKSTSGSSVPALPVPIRPIRPTDQLLSSDSLLGLSFRRRRIGSQYQSRRV